MTLLDFFLTVTFFGSVKWALITAIFWSLFLYREKLYSILTRFIFALGGSEALVLILKYSVQRPRPAGALALYEDPYSFPSGHSNISVVLYGFIAYVVAERYCKNKTQKIFVYFCALGLMILIGSSRLYLGVHYPSDVVGGYSIGIATLLASLDFFREKIPSKKLHHA